MQVQLSTIKKRKKELEKEVDKIAQEDQELEGEAEVLRKQMEGSNPEQQREKELERRKKLRGLEEKEAKELGRLEKLREDLVTKEDAQEEEEKGVRQ